MKLDIDSLKKECKKIHFFGLGFIQLKLNKYERLHFYTDRLLGIIPDEDVHNHRYDFTSQVLKGIIENNTYVFTHDPLGLYTKRLESCNPSVKVTADPIKGNITSIKQSTIYRLDKYVMNHEEFHKVRPIGDTITYLIRSDYKKDTAEVVSHNLSPLVCPFSKQVSEEELWEIVEDMIKGM